MSERRSDGSSQPAPAKLPPLALAACRLPPACVPVPWPQTAIIPTPPAHHCRAGQCKACGAWNSLEKVTIGPAAESSGGGSGARAAARFAAGKTTTGGSFSEEGSRPASKPLRRSAWVQDMEGGWVS